MEQNLLDAWAHVEDYVEKLTGVRVPLSHHTEGEKKGPCPFCQDLPDGAHNDGFVVFIEGNFFCRKCKAAGRNTAKGWWLPSTFDIDRTLVAKEIEHKKTVKWHQAVAELRSAQSMSEIMGYPLHEQAIDVWMSWGFDENEIKTHHLGFCPSSVTVPDQPSATIPVVYRNKLVDVRHRILQPTDEASKYRSHLPGLRPWFYNADIMGAGQTVHMVEGEKKAIILQRVVGKRTVGYPGINTLDRLAILLEKAKTATGNYPFRSMHFYPDPGTFETIWPYAENLARSGIEVTIYDLNFKVDDFIIDFGPGEFNDQIYFNAITV